MLPKKNSIFYFEIGTINSMHATIEIGLKNESFQTNENEVIRENTSLSKDNAPQFLQSI